MTVEKLINKLSECNPKSKVLFCETAMLSDLEFDAEDNEAFVTIRGVIDTLSVGKKCVTLSFEEI